MPVLIEAGYRGFNLVRYGQKIYAIPQGEGAFEIERIRNNGVRLSRVDIFLALSYEHLCELGEEEEHHHIDLGSLYGDGIFLRTVSTKVTLDLRVHTRVEE